MGAAHEEHRVGLDHLAAVTELLHRVRAEHPTAGLLEAADLQWWWRRPRPTDTVPQLLWFDDAGRPEAAVVATDWGDVVALDPIVLPDAPADWVTHVLERGLDHAAACGLAPVEVVVDEADHVARDVLARHGYVTGRAGGAVDLGVADSWLDAADRPAVTPLPDGYRSVCRLDTMDRPHHMVDRNGPDVEARLRQTSLYRPDLDLLVVDEHDTVAAYALCWSDPVTGVGLVEPMRTEDDHQRRGLARHLLTTGIERLAAAGASRIKICFDPANPASRDLYLGVGFRRDKQAIVLRRR